MVTVTAPPQLSVAVGAVKLVTSHWAVTSASVALSATGAVVSVITTSRADDGVVGCAST